MRRGPERERWCSGAPRGPRYIGSMRIRGGSAGFRLCEAVRVRVGVDVVLTFCNASAVSRSDVASITGLSLCRPPTDRGMRLPF